eukprot:6218487-Amphidinium_carterae.1
MLYSFSRLVLHGLHCFIEKTGSAGKSVVLFPKLIHKANAMHAHGRRLFYWKTWLAKCKRLHASSLEAWQTSGLVEVVQHVKL